MINPSAPGWIAKYFTKQKTLRETGTMSTDLFIKTEKLVFIYGHIIVF
jgi:hypothetical protein